MVASETQNVHNIVGKTHKIILGFWHTQITTSKLLVYTVFVPTRLYIALPN